jgi:DNA-binding transcriptional LysR family regulator
MGYLMELRQVQTFRAVAEELSFSRAAAKLGYVQSSVSAQVGALERELGVPLFDRLGRRIKLTDAGEVMLAHSRRLLALAQETKGAVVDAGMGSGEVTGSLTVSAPETLITYRLPKLLALFHERHPKVRLSVRPSSIGRLVGSARRAVEDGTVDVAFVLDEPLDERVRLADLAVETLAAEDITVIAPASHALAYSSVVLPRDLQGETVLLPEAPESGCAYRGQFERQLGSARVLPAETMEFQSIEAVKQCVAAGMGVSVLPNITVGAELKAGKLAALRWEEPFEVLTQMSWNKGRWKSPSLRAFLEASREAFSLVRTPAR